MVVDDAAVTRAYVRGLAADRELPIIRKIALGSLRNKILFILPAALILSAIAPVLVEIILMVGGTYLCFEGAEKVHHLGSSHRRDAEQVPAVVQGGLAEAKTIAGAIRTDFILSAEIMVIALKEVLEEGIVRRAIILVVVALAITAVVYGAVALIVKMDDIGLRLAQRGQPSWVLTSSAGIGPTISSTRWSTGSKTCQASVVYLPDRKHGDLRRRRSRCGCDRRSDRVACATQ